VPNDFHATQSGIKRGYESETKSVSQAEFKQILYKTVLKQTEATFVEKNPVKFITYQIS
jgi:hypothetical protein